MSNLNLNTMPKAARQLTNATDDALARNAEIPARMSSLDYEIGELESAINVLGQRLHDGGVLSQAMGKTMDEAKGQHDTTGLGASLSQQIARLYQLRDVVGEITRRLEV